MIPAFAVGSPIMEHDHIFQSFYSTEKNNFNIDLTVATCTARI